MSDLAVIDAYQRRYGAIREGVSARIALAWNRFGGLTDADLEAFTRIVLPLASAAESTTVALVDAYVATLSKSAPLGLDPKDLTGKALRGVDPAEVFARPVIEARAAISEGADYAGAMARGAARAKALAEVDVILSQRAAMNAVVDLSPRIVGYRRVLTGKSCPLCISASTRQYGPFMLMPIHNHCDCGVSPIYGSSDPGATANAKHATPDRAVAYEVHQHGELGAVLTPKGESFTGPSDLN